MDSTLGASRAHNQGPGGDSLFEALILEKLGMGVTVRIASHPAAGRILSVSGHLHKFEPRDRLEDDTGGFILFRDPAQSAWVMKGDLLVQFFEPQSTGLDLLGHPLGNMKHFRLEGRIQVRVMEFEGIIALGTGGYDSTDFPIPKKGNIVGGKLLIYLVISVPVCVIAAAFLLLKYGGNDIQPVQNFKGITGDLGALGMGKDLIEDGQTTGEVADRGFRIDSKSCLPSEASLRKMIEIGHHLLDGEQEASVFAVIARVRLAGQMAILT